MKKVTEFLLKNRKVTYFLAVFWTAVIFYGCSLPGKELPKLTLFDQIDKVVHFVFFFIFYLLWSSLFNIKQNKHIILLLISSLYGLSIEYYQKYFVAGRNFDIWDVFADTLGAFICLALISKNTKNSY